MFKTEEYEKIIFNTSPFDEKIYKIRNLIKKGEKLQAFKALTIYCLSNLEKEKQEIINQEIKKLIKDQEIIDYILSNDPIIIFNLPEGEIFKEFVDEYYDVLKEYFKDRLIYQYSCITDDLNDEPFPAYYKKDFNYWDNQKEFPQLSQLNFIILPIRKDSYNCYYFYKKFRDSIDICITNDGFNSIFSSIEFPRLLELFKEEYKYKNYNSYLIFHEILCRSRINNYQYSGPIDLSIYKEIYKRYKEGYYIENIDFFTKQIMEIIDTSSEVSEEFDLINYMSNIKYLRSLPKQERRKSKTYQDLFKQYKTHFLNECRKGFIKDSLINLTDEDNHILELVFSRSINQDYIFETLKINSLEKLYFFFKTNSIEISKDNISLDAIKRFNVKQYYSIKEKMNIPSGVNNSLMTEDIEKLKSDNFRYEKISNEQIIELLCKYDYDYLNTLITKKGIKCEILTLLKSLDPEKLKIKIIKKSFIK